MWPEALEVLSWDLEIAAFRRLSNAVGVLA